MLNIVLRSYRLLYIRGLGHLADAQELRMDSLPPCLSIHAFDGDTNRYRFHGSPSRRERYVTFCRLCNIIDSFRRPLGKRCLHNAVADSHHLLLPQSIDHLCTHSGAALRHALHSRLREEPKALGVRRGDRNRARSSVLVYLCAYGR